VRYEAEVYRTVLKPIGGATPVFYGHYTDPNNGTTWLMIEYMDSCLRLSMGPLPDVLIGAARWLGEFHTALEHRLARAPLAFLNRYTEEYYVGWARRACEFAGPSHTRFPWFKALCENFEKLVYALLEAPQTVIHGEFYPKNVLIRNGTIFPVDWESAAVAAGQIDLTALTQGWPADTVTECELAYPGFDHTLDAARIYFHLRWLGDKPSRTMLDSSQWHFEKLRSKGEKCGLI
jgi:aminoglycoside phosphotransferase (APT) family kinase protein